MTLKDAIEAIRTTPGDNLSPALLVYDGDLPEFAIDEITASPYNRAPYVVITGLPRARELAYHAGGGIMNGLLDVNVLQLSSTATADNGAAIARVAAAIIETLPTVDEIATGYPLVGRLSLETETDPYPLDLGGATNWSAALRVAYRIHR